VIGAGVRILICHGYLLRGTGSNQYVQSLSRALCRQGHNLVVMCQEDDPRLDFVSVFMRGNPGGTGLEVVWQQDTDYPGTCMVLKPDIGGFLPVYVYDSYPGFAVVEFTNLTEEELGGYIDKNRTALLRVIEQFEPEAIQVNHAVMLPCIVRPVAEKAGVPYFVTVHGSEIEFTIKKDPRYLEFGAEGLAGARGIVAPSEHSADVAREIFGPVIDVSEKIVFIPPGVDTVLFDVAGKSLPESVRGLLALVEERTAGVAVGDFQGRSEEGAGGAAAGGIEREIERINALHPDWLPDPDVAGSLQSLAEGGRPFLMFLGKLIETKGLQCVLAAMPLIMREHPETCLVVVGFGELRGFLQLMLEALDAGDVRRLRDLCEYGNRSYLLTDSAFTPVLAFLDELAGEGTLDDYLRLCEGLDLAGAVIFTGYLAPEEHRFLLPHARALLVPSLAPESFGMVATEAMACGVVPIAAYHSGLETALAPLKKAWGSGVDSLLLGTREKLVFRIAAAARVVLDMSDYALREMGAVMRSAVAEEFSWDAICRRMVELFLS
jgi:glycosyltransferase involved in cell wall biosynthesis